MARIGTPSTRRRSNREASRQCPAWFLRLLPRALAPPAVLAWCQDRGERSIHPIRGRGETTAIRQESA